MKTSLMLDKLYPSARIVDGTLIITLPDAVRPVVWQMEMGQTKASGMEVREHTDGSYLLMLKTSRQDVQEIAPYATRDQAVRALLAISKALETAQGQLRPGFSPANAYPLPALVPQSRPGRAKLARVAIGLIIICGLLYAVTRLGPPTPETLAPAAGDTAAPAAVGEPLSADDYLK